eukprot:3603069-Rhodomonas_salina.1
MTRNRACENPQLQLHQALTSQGGCRGSQGRTVRGRALQCLQQTCNLNLSVIPYPLELGLTFSMQLCFEICLHIREVREPLHARSHGRQRKERPAVH